MGKSAGVVFMRTLILIPVFLVLVSLSASGQDVNHGWALDLKSGSVDSPLLLHNGSIYVMTSGIYWQLNKTVSPVISRINATYGQVIWSREFNGTWQVAGLAIADDLLVSGTSRGDLMGLYLSNGTYAWNIRLPDPITSKPLYANDRLFVATERSLIAYTNLSSPQQIWNVSLSKVYRSSPVKAENLIVLGDTSGTLHAFDSATGVEVWSRDLGAPIKSTPAYGDGMIFAVASGRVHSRLFALSINGSLMWSRRMDMSVSPPTLHDDVIYIGTRSGSVHAITVTNSTLWDLTVTGSVDAKISVWGDSICVMTNEPNGTVYRISITDHQIIWNYTPIPHAHLFSDPAADRMFYFASDNGVIYAIDDHPVQDPYVVTDSLSTSATSAPLEGNVIEIYYLVRNRGSGTSNLRAYLFVDDMELGWMELILGAGQEKAINFTWKAEKGRHTLVAQIEVMGEEIRDDDHILTLEISVVERAGDEETTFMMLLIVGLAIWVILLFLAILVRKALVRKREHEMEKRDGEGAEMKERKRRWGEQ